MFLLFLAAIAVVSFTAFKNPELQQKLTFHPYSIQHNGEWYRLLSHVFVHGSVGHVLINLFVFWSFGDYVLTLFMELKGPVFGAVLFVFMMMAAAVFSSIKAFAKHRENPSYHAVGASGVVSAVLFSFVLMQPLNSIYLFFIPIPIPAFIFGVVYLGYEYYMDKKSTDRIAHDAHFYGAVLGLLFTVFLDFRIPNMFVKQVMQYFS